MEADRIRVTVRPRSGLEAIDLGFRLCREWWREIWGAWFVLVVPLMLAIILALRDHPFWAVLILWWLRPAFDRVPLHVIGRALFGERPDVRDTLAATPELLRTGVLSSLTWLRLSPGRTFLLPVLQLEGLRGAARAARSAALARRDLGSASVLLFAGAHFNAILVLGGISALQLFIPEELAIDVLESFVPFLGDAAEDAWQFAIPAAYALGVTVVEPFLVAGGFALYVNRRVYLEGWDVELAFHGLARRSAGRIQPGVAAVVGGIALGLAALPVDAQSPGPCVPAATESAARCIAAVLEEPVFATEREVTIWAPKEFEGADGEDFAFPEWIGDAVAQFIELFLWIVGAIVVITVAIVLARGVRRPGRIVVPDEPPVPTLFGLDLDPESLPSDVVAAARDAWAEGQALLALSLLYRGALVYVNDRRGVPIPASATEGDCLRLARPALDPAAREALGDLTESWMRARYAHEPPGGERFESLCGTWSRVLGSGT